MPCGHLEVLIAALGALIEKRLQRIIPEMFCLFLTPLFTFLLAGTIAILFLQPFGGFLSDLIGQTVTTAINTGGAITGFLLGGLWLPLVMLGLHQAFTPIHVDLLARYGVKLNRRTLKAYLDDLIEAGFPLNTSKRQRILPDGSEETLQTDWYLEPRFEISELRLLCDLLNGMPAVPTAQRDSLTEKLIRFAPPSFPRTQMQQPITYLHTLPAQQMMFSVELLCEAMRRNCMVSFQYGSYALNADGTPELKPRVREDGGVREYLVSPYEIVVSHGPHDGNADP